MKKIIWISNFAPIKANASAGSQTFRYYINSFLDENDFDIRLITCAKYKEKNYVEDELREVQKHVIYWNNPTERKFSKLINIESKFNLFNRNANIISNTTEKEILKTLVTWVNDGYMPDIIILEWTEMVMLAKKIKQLFPKVKLIASEHDVTFVGYERKTKYYKGIKGIYWKIRLMNEKKCELQALKKCDLILPHNPDNIEILKKEGIDSEKMESLTPYFADLSEIDRKPNEKDILFYGAMGRPENYLTALWFIQNVMPLLQDIDIRFVVLGSNPPEVLRKFENARIHITGFVDDIIPYFESAMCFVAPLVMGAGIKVKILESLSSSVPVLTNDIGIEGIPAKNGIDFFYCEQPEEFLEVIHKIKDMKDEYHTVSGRRFIQEHYSLQKAKEQYIDRVKKL